MVKFLADEMLGTVAKWLRILGFDTEYARDMEDYEILLKAGKEGRVLITRDAELFDRAKRRGLKAIYLPHAELDRDMKEIISVYPPEKERFMCRCTVCNSEIVEIPKKDVRGRVPEGVYERQERFWYCEKCGRIYWEGSHWEKMRSFVEEILK